MYSLRRVFIGRLKVKKHNRGGFGSPTKESMRQSRIEKIKNDKSIRARMVIIQQAKRLVCSNDSRLFAEYCGLGNAQEYHDRARGHLNISDVLLWQIKAIVNSFSPHLAQERTLKADTLKKIDAELAISDDEASETQLKAEDAAALKVVGQVLKEKDNEN